jgi:hypothetical protein
MWKQKKGKAWEIKFYLQKATQVEKFYDILEKIKQEWVQEQVKVSNWTIKSLND